MNTRKQILVMSALLLMMLIITGIYGAWYPSRETDAQTEFDEATAKRAAILFARNCRLCHGDVGEGGALGARLAAAPGLDRADLQGFTDVKVKLSSNIDASTTSVPVNDGAKFKAAAVILVEDERMEVKKIDGNTLTVERGLHPTTASPHLADANVLLRDADALKDKTKLITNTITCGRVGTAMPIWGQSQGGTLSDEQIRQLMVLITQDRWDLVKEEVDVEDLVPSKLTQAMSDATISMFVTDVSLFTVKEAIRIGEERMRLTGVPDLPKDKNNQLPKDKSGVITVERGILKSAPQEHAVEEKIYRFPEAPEPSINASTCGQTAQAPAPAGTPGTIEPFTGQTIIVIAANIAFDKKELTAKTGSQIRLRLDNRDAATKHNVAVYKSSTDLTPASSGSVGLTFDGPGIDDTVFDAPAVGSYFFRCDVHPTIMTGTFTVTN
ncbi:MAG TPA: hypothetical protein VI759_03090 [Dehalococcoidia bacterium]|nr:hypothetical protein [Dehalococcoidia bacterium]